MINNHDTSSIKQLLQTHDEEFICPISKKKFDYPLVISCGHTFDKKSIQNLINSICPLCKSSFNKSESVPNWILIDYLNLNIKLDSKNIIPYTAFEAKDESEKIEINNKLLFDIERKIKKNAILGKSNLIYSYNTYRVSPRMINSIQSKLKNAGFYTSTWSGYLWYDDLYVSWNHPSTPFLC